MWLFTRHGFYSLTRSQTKPDKIQIRARSRRDLQNLQARTHNSAPLLKTLNADYRWRIIVTPGESERIVSWLTRDIDYPNFKASVGQRSDQAHRVADYHRIWEIHHDWQSADGDRDGPAAGQEEIPRN